MFRSRPALGRPGKKNAAPVPPGVGADVLGCQPLTEWPMYKMSWPYCRLHTVDAVARPCSPARFGPSRKQTGVTELDQGIQATLQSAGIALHSPKNRPAPITAIPSHPLAPFLHNQESKFSYSSVMPDLLT